MPNGNCAFQHIKLQRRECLISKVVREILHSNSQSMHASALQGSTPWKQSASYCSPGFACSFFVRFEAWKGNAERSASKCPLQVCVSCCIGAPDTLATSCYLSWRRDHLYHSYLHDVSDRKNRAPDVWSRSVGAFSHEVETCCSTSEQPGGGSPCTRSLPPLKTFCGHGAKERHPEHQTSPSNIPRPRGIPSNGNMSGSVENRGAYAFVISLWPLAHFEHVYQEQVGRAVKDTVKLEPICSHCHRFRTESALFRAQNVWKFTPLCQVSPMWKWVTTWWMALDALKCSNTYSKSISFTVTTAH